MPFPFLVQETKTKLQLYFFSQKVATPQSEQTQGSTGSTSGPSQEPGLIEDEETGDRALYW